MAILRTEIIRALEELIDNEAGTAFQALVVVLAKQKWPDLIATEWHNDGGLDAYAPALLADSKKGMGVASSLTATLTKVRGDAKTAKANYDDLEILIFATPRKVTASTAKDWAEKVRAACGVELYVMSREDIITSLMLPENAALCSRLPGITVPVEQSEANLLAKVRAAVAEEAELWRRRQRMTDRPIISLHAVKLESNGKETDDTTDIEAWRTALAESRRITMEAPGGAGKTTILVQLATEPPRDSEVSFLVDLPAWVHSGSDLLGFIARSTPFRARNITPADLAQLAQRTHFSFLLNGWNEIADVHSSRAITALDELERNFPAAGIVVATRTHYLSPPLQGATRVKLLGITRQQRAEYLKQALGNRAEELRLQLEGSQVLDKLTRTPLILAEVVTIFQSGNPIPSTRVGVLGTVMSLIEGATNHKPHLQRPPLNNHAERYLTDLAAKMTERGEVLIFATEARAAIQSVSTALHAEGQVATQPNPDEILHVLTAHHVLEQIDGPSVGYRFQHQQFQEFYAARFLTKALNTLVSKQGAVTDMIFAASYINKPMWEEPLNMVAEEVSLAVEHDDTKTSALERGAHLIRMALRVDPILAADLARLTGLMIWKEVQVEVGVVLRHWYSIGDVHHKQLALAAMMATASDDFADVTLPLLTDVDQQVRLATYRAGDTFYPSSVGTDWQSIVDSWHEDARADFVSEIARRGSMADVGERFASRDPSEKVRTRAIRELCWISASDALERVVIGLDDTALDAVLPAFFPEAVPKSVLSRFIAGNRRLIAREPTPLGRIRLCVKGVEYGDDAIAPKLMEELTALSPPIDQQAASTVEAALKIVKRHDPAWASNWLSAKLLDGSLTGEHWRPLLQPVSREQGNDLVHSMATRELSYRERAAMCLILSIEATSELAKLVFDELCTLRRSISATGAQQQVWTCYDQLRGLFRVFSVEIAVTGMMCSLDGDFDQEKFRVVADLFGRISSDAEELRSALPAELHESLRRYLKDGIAKILADDLFSDEIRSEAAISLGRIGKSEDLADLERMIDADINSAESKLGSTSYSSWYLQAIAYLDAPDADTKLISLLRNNKYALDAARGLLQLAMPYRREKPFFGNATDFEGIWKARDGMRPPGLDQERAKRYGQALKERIAELKQETATSATPQQGRIKELATILAALDGRDSADVVMEALVQPEQWDAHTRVNGVRALLMSGATLSLDSMRAVLDPAIEHVISQGMYRDQSLTLLIDCLELLPFSDDPAAAILRIEEVLEKFEHRPYQVRDLVTAMGYTRSEAAVSFLLKVARSKSALQNLETAWLEALGRLNTESSRQTLLSFVDPEIPSVGVNLDFDFHNTEVYAAFVGTWARQDPALKKRLLALSAGTLNTTQQRLLPAIYREIGDQDTIVAGANLLRGSLSPIVGRGGLEAQFMERQPHGSSGSFSLIPRNAEQARAELFQAVLHDPDRRKAAFSILGQVEVWRIEYGRPLGEPRHPMIESGEPWPPLRFFPKD
jgi:hypothetical protein